MTVTNRLLALLLGLALFGAGVIALVEVVLAALGRPFVLVPGRSWLATLRHTSWNSTTVETVLVGIGIVGLLLLALEIAPRRRRWLEAELDGRTVEVYRKGAESYVSRRIATETPATRVRAAVKGRGTGWRIEVRARVTPEAAALVEATARSAVERLNSVPARVRMRAGPARVA